jgi:hypothetical protein
VSDVTTQMNVSRSPTRELETAKRSSFIPQGRLRTFSGVRNKEPQKKVSGGKTRNNSSLGYVKKWHVGIRTARKLFLECVKKHD